MDAHLTNALTNGLHALFLLLYFLAALRARLLGNMRFTKAVLGFFFLTFALKILGVLVHVNPMAKGIDELWLCIAAGLILLNCLVLQALNFSAAARIGALLFFALCTFVAVERKDFTFLAVEILATYLAAALYCSGLLRIGFVSIAISNVVWIVTRKGTEAFLGHQIPTEWRYDNDLFHFMLIASTFVIYKGFSTGNGLPRPDLSCPRRCES
ncbi:MAG: hypothetical protein ACI8UO_004855 [Verrucomicrobiales bacterium]|jgi:hypothetical protein